MIHTKDYAEHTLNKNNGNIEFSKTVINTKADLSKTSAEMQFYAESFQELEVLESNSKV